MLKPGTKKRKGIFLENQACSSIQKICRGSKMRLLELRGHRLLWTDERDGPGRGRQEGRKGRKGSAGSIPGVLGTQALPVGGQPTCSSSLLCSFRRASIFPMTSWRWLLSSSMSRRCWPSLSCSAGGPQGAQRLPAIPAGSGCGGGPVAHPVVPRSCWSCCRSPSSRSWVVVRCEASTREDSSCRLLENFSICSMMPFRDLGRGADWVSPAPGPSPAP